MDEERCGRCIWHFDLFGSNEAGGLANCLARNYDEVYEVLSTREARCDMPGRFVRRKEESDAASASKTPGGGID